MGLRALKTHLGGVGKQGAGVGRRQQFSSVCC